MEPSAPCMRMQRLHPCANSTRHSYTLAVRAVLTVEEAGDDGAKDPRAENASVSVSPEAGLSDD